MKLNVMSIPTLMLMKNGTLEASSIGLRSKNEILEMIS